MQRHTLYLALASLITLGPGLSGAADLEGRVTRLENILDSQRASDLTLQVQGLEREVQRLRGQVEQQKHELDNLRRQAGGQAGGQAVGQAAVGPAGGQSAGAVPPEPAPTSPGRAPLAGTPPDAAALKSALAPTPAEAAAAEAGKPKAGVESSVPPLNTLAPPEAPAPEPAKVEQLPKAGEATPATAESQAPAQPAPGEQEAYIKAVEPLKQRRFEEASVSLTEFVTRFPGSANADKAHFWLAETHYVNRNIPAALKEFQTVLRDYPKSSKVPGALLKIGYIQDDAKDPKAARATLEELIRRFPQSGEAKLAQGRLEQMQQAGR